MRVELHGISKRFGSTAVLREISLSLSGGERVLLLGRNGAGKSTLLRVCAGLMRADSGNIHIDGARVASTPLSEVGYVTHQPMLYAELTIRENLGLTSKLRDRSIDIDAQLKAWGLAQHANKRIRELSKGQQSKASLAQALVHCPKFICLDEPTSALDDISSAELFECLKSMPQSLLIMASHDVSRVKDFCSRVLLLDEGMLVADSASSASPGEVIDRYRRGNR